MLLLLILLLLITPTAAWAEYKTIGEIGQAYSVETCGACHRKIHEEWHASAHAHSVANSIGILRDFIEWQSRADVEVRVTMFPSPKEEIIVHRTIKTIHLGI